MKRSALPLAVALLVAIGCGTVPERDVRFEPTPEPIVQAMLELAAVGPTDVVYDLGSGDGRIPIAAARDFGARGVGIEIDPALVRRARANARAAGVAHKVEFRRGNMHEADIRDATVVTLFLHPQPNLKLRPKLQAELRPGARVVSYMWDMGDWAPDDKRPAGRHEIFVWRILERTSLGGRTPPALRVLERWGEGARAARRARSLRHDQNVTVTGSEQADPPISQTL